jgi:hypothetical protein
MECINIKVIRETAIITGIAHKIRRIRKVVISLSFGGSWVRLAPHPA